MLVQNARSYIEDYSLGHHSLYALIEWDGGQFNYRVCWWEINETGDLILSLIDTRHSTYKRENFYESIGSSFNSMYGIKPKPQPGVIATFTNFDAILAMCPPNSKISFKVQTQDGPYSLSLDYIAPAKDKWSGLLICRSAPAFCNYLHHRGIGSQYETIKSLDISLLQLRRLIYKPFSSPKVVEFNKDPNYYSNSSFIEHCMLILKKLLDNPAKATVCSGNLPRKFVQDVTREVISGMRDSDRFSDVPEMIRDETSSMPISEARHFLQKHGYLKKFNGYFILTEKGEDLAREDFTGESFYNFFKSYTTSKAWINYDISECAFFHDTIMVSAFLLDRYGDEPRPLQFYSDIFFKIFPYAMDTFIILGDNVTKRESASTLESDSASTYIFVIEQYFRAMSLARFIEPEEVLPVGLERQFHTKMQKTKILGDFIKFPNK